MNKSFLKHHFLIAMPSLNDLNFSKSVIYLYEHNAEGAMGLVINKPLHVTLGNVLRHLKIEFNNPSIEHIPVLLGGPVGQDHGFVLHNKIESTADDYVINDEIMLSASKEILINIANGQGPQQFLVALGYSGWGRGQLELEIARNDWLIAQFNPKVLFETPIDERWSAAAKLIGVDLLSLSDQIGHA